MTMLAVLKNYDQAQHSFKLKAHNVSVNHLKLGIHYTSFPSVAYCVKRH